MLSCDGYRMFRGTATITPRTAARPPFDVTGTWLYRPDTECWYVGGDSYPVALVGNFRDSEALEVSEHG